METYKHKYHCIYCNYVTNNGQAWYQHNKGKKHNNNKKIAEKNKNNNTNTDSVSTIHYTNSYENTNFSTQNTNNLSVINENNKFICNFCQKQFAQKCNLYRHRKECKKKYTIKKSGLYCMWNHKMVDEEGNNYYKLGRTSSRESRISNYARDYDVSKHEIKFMYEVEFENEVFAEKFLFYFLQEYRINKIKELFNVNLDTIKDTMNKLKLILDSNPKIHNPSMILDNFNNIMNENIENLTDEDEKDNKIYLKSLLNGDYEVVKQIQHLDNLVRPYQCEYCKKKYPSKKYVKYHLENHCHIYLKIKQEEEKRKEEENQKQRLEQQKIDMEIWKEEQRKLEEHRKLEEEKRKGEENLKQRKLEEQQKIDMEIWKEEQFKLPEERKEIERKLEEQKKNKEQELIQILLEERRIEKEEQRKREEEQRKREEKQAEEQRKLLEMILLSQRGNPGNLSEANADSLNQRFDEIQKELNEKLDKFMKTAESNPKNLDQSHTTTNSGTYFEAQTQNNLLNNLNLNYTNVISMNQFLYNMEHINKIPRSDLEAIAFASTNLSEADLAETIHRTIEKNCIEQTKGMKNPGDGQELLPCMPVVCSDGNCRSHKEKVNEFWETVYGDKHFDHMLDIIDKRLYEVLKKKIYLEDYGKKKLFKKIKRKNTIHDMKSFQEKVNGHILGKKFRSI